MLIRNLKVFIDAASKHNVIGVVVSSIETGDEIAVTYDLDFDIDEYGDMLLYIQI